MRVAHLKLYGPEGLRAMVFDLVPGSGELLAAARHARRQGDRIEVQWADVPPPDARAAYALKLRRRRARQSVRAEGRLAELAASDPVKTHADLLRVLTLLR